MNNKFQILEYEKFVIVFAIKYPFFYISIQNLIRYILVKYYKLFIMFFVEIRVVVDSNNFRKYFF